MGVGACVRVGVLGVCGGLWARESRADGFDGVGGWLGRVRAVGGVCGAVGVWCRVRGRRVFV